MIKDIIASKKGASSILVILLLVVLMVFGVAALTTALSSMRLSQKVTEWNAQYYEAEAIAWERFAEIDRAVASLSNADEASVKTALAGLDFDTDIETSDGSCRICYEAWSKDGLINIDAALSLDTSDGSLRVVQWQEKQREGTA
jgi:Tfp pilus assembly protein PilX